MKSNMITTRATNLITGDVSFYWVDKTRGFLTESKALAAADWSVCWDSIKVDLCPGL
jgi:hypothetical protein